ncbi:hypothetical protein NDU88_003191 [Pleurodeles waltl]|uniref:Uncharacterized protein n=1 Tax=Pleurodeles waltl TaxID=8319 RepID=A0AAV7LEJ5_PLEWA|nr:hypothetical protein NDU88_003191 [Pleurodeles waltl]
MPGGAHYNPKCPLRQEAPTPASHLEGPINIRGKAYRLRADRSPRGGGGLRAGPGSCRALSRLWSVPECGPSRTSGGEGRRPVPSAGAGALRGAAGRGEAEADGRGAAGGPERVSPTGLRPELHPGAVTGPRGGARVALGHPGGGRRSGNPRGTVPHWATRDCSWWSGRGPQSGWGRPAAMTLGP